MQLKPAVAKFVHVEGNLIQDLFQMIKTGSFVQTWNNEVDIYWSAENGENLYSNLLSIWP